MKNVLIFSLILMAAIFNVEAQQVSESRETRTFSTDLGVENHTDPLEKINMEMGLGALEQSAISSLSGGYEKARQYKGSNTDLLFAMLNKPALRIYWHRIAYTIAVVGGADDFIRLRDWVVSPLLPAEDVPFLRQYIERRGAMVALKHAARDNDLPWVNDFLLESAKPESWESKLDVDSRTANDLADAAVTAIAVSGTDDSIEMLNSLKNTGLDRVAKGRRKVASQSISEADSYITNMLEVAKHHISFRKNGN